MATATLDGAILSRCEARIFATGIPVVDIEITDEVAIRDRAALTIGTLTMVVSPIRQGTWQERTTARMVGGSAGWRRTIPAKGYGSPVGVSIAQVIADAAREVGEFVSTAAVTSSGPFLAREEGPASQVFGLLPPGVTWWVASDGSTVVGVRPARVSTARVEVMSWDPGLGRLVIGCEDNAAITPGTTIVDPTIGAVVANSVHWTIADDRLRGEVWTA